MSATVDSIGIMRIMRMIPHRYPMLLIDRVDHIIKDVSATGIKAVSINEPFFQGHFPGRPIMPGVLIVEAMAQTAAVQSIYSMEGATEGKLVYFMSIDNAKFRKPVEPGMMLYLDITQIKSRGKIKKFTSVARTDSGVMAEAEFTAMIADRPEDQ